MIRLYPANETNFEHNGLGLLNMSLKKCQVEEELNNLYTLSALYPISGKFGKIIKNGMIIKAPTPGGDQLFRIYQSKPSMGMLEIHAFHIFYDLAFNFVEDTNIVSKSGQAWLQQLSRSTQYSHPFVFFSDISTVSGSRVVRKNCVEILLNTSLENSFVNRFGGEILRDNFKVYFNRSIGQNRGFKIRHKKNLKGYSANIDDKSVITRIMPIGFDGLLLPERYIDSPRIGDYPFPRIGKLDVDVKAAVGEHADDEDALPLEKAYEKMREMVREQFGIIDIPKCSYDVDFVELSKTKEYEDFQELETVRIGDTVSVDHSEDNFCVEAKVIRYSYDCLSKTIDSITAGQFESRSSSNSLNQKRTIEQKIEDVRSETNNMIQSAANGKNTIYRGSDRPTNASIGDLWYEPLENSIVLKQWSGTDWELIPISDQNLGNVNVNNLSGNAIDIRRFRISSGDRDILYVNDVGEVILNAKRVQIDFQDVATKKDLKAIELTPGPKGADGRTAYVHWAYSDNADGTGLSVEDNGQRYIGHYSDYTQADSTDKTKYRWADRWAKIEVGGSNLLLNTASLPLGNRLNGTWASVSGGNGTATVVEFNDFPSSLLKKGIRVLNNTNGGNKDFSQAINLTVGETYTASCWARVSSDSNQSTVNFLMRCWGNNDFNKVLVKAINHRDWKRYSLTFVADKVGCFIQFGQNGGGIIEICGMKCELGTVATDYSLADEDVNTKIDSKADATSTAQSLAELTKQSLAIETILETKLESSDLEELQGRFASLDTGYAKLLEGAKEITDIQGRISAYEINLKEQQMLWNAVAANMTFSDDGLILGRSGSNLKTRVLNDRLEFVDGGKVVAYVSNQQLFILSGTFVEALIVGNHKFEKLGKTHTVISYVGGN